MTYLPLARTIAQQAFAGKTDKAGRPFLGEYEIKRLKKYHAAYLDLMAFKNT